MISLTLQAPRRYWNILKPYCDSFLYDKDVSGFKVIKPVTLNVISYKNRNIKPVINSAKLPLYLNSDLDYAFAGARNNLGVRLSQGTNVDSFGLFQINSMNEIYSFKDHVNGKLTSIITWWPVAIGLQGRLLHETWPQIIQPKNDAIAASTAWLEYIARCFREELILTC